jgi:putative two-component system response regulator
MDMTTPSARILAIDEDSEVLKMARQVLGGQFACEMAGDVSTALHHLFVGQFDLVLCDLQMPGESGLALAEELTAELTGTVIVPIARSDDVTLVELAFELGVYGYLIKPFSPEQLQVTTQIALRRSELESAERAGGQALQETIQAAVDRAPIPIFVKDLERRYLLANRFTHEVMQQAPGEMVGRTDAEMHSEETERVIREGDMRVLRDEEPSFRDMTVEIMGRERTFLTVRFPYIDAEGNLAGLVGVSAEITAQREAEADLRERAASQAREIEDLHSSRREIVERLAQAIEMHDVEAGRHVDRVARIAAYLGSQLGLGDSQIALLRAAAPMHDVGKIATPEEILRKPGPLSAEERHEMELHPEIGHRILAGGESELLQMAARIALTHHERFDGTGYPQGLAGEEIPIEGRIVAVADVFDALLSDRPYRPALGTGEAIELVRRGRGTQFDPEVVDVLLEHLEDAIALRD